MRPRVLWRQVRKRTIHAGSWVYHLPYVHPVLLVVGRTGRGFYRDDCHIMAAAIAFYAVLSLIPFLLLLISLAGFLLSHIGKDYASYEDLFTHLATYARAVVPFLGDDVVDRLRGMMLNRRAYGITGMAILLLTAGLVFRTLELAFARVFKTKRQRSMLVSQLIFVVFLLAVGLLFLLVHYVGVITSTFYSARDVEFHRLLNQFLQEHAPLRVVVTILTATFVFVVLLKYFSKERVKLRYALWGGVLFSFLWMLAVHFFGYYLEHVARFSLLYGSLATLAIIVVWIFYSACILLLCSEFTCVLQSRERPASVSTANESPPDR